MIKKSKYIIDGFAIIFFLVPIFASAQADPFSPIQGDRQTSITFYPAEATTSGETVLMYVPDTSFPPVLDVCDIAYIGGPYLDPCQTTIDNLIGPYYGSIDGTYTFIITRDIDFTEAQCYADGVNFLSPEECAALPGSLVSGQFYICGDGSISSVACKSQVGFTETAGFSMNSTGSWMWENLAKPIFGSGLGVLYTLRWYIITIIVLGILIFFAFRYFGFFRK